MLFWLKKAIGYAIMPVPLCLGALAIGLFLLWRGRTPKLARGFLTAGVVLLLLFSNKFVSQALVRPIEQQYAPVPELSASNIPPAVAQCRYVIVLGGGNGRTPGTAAINMLSTSARARVTEAVRILRVLPDARLLVSGPGKKNEPTHATVLERAAISLGIDPARIQRIEHARDTEDEAAAVRNVAGTAKVALVTSAWHMPRSVALFRAAGVDVLPCPTDISAHDDGEFHWRDFLFDVESIERSSFAIRERVGYAWIWLRRKTG